MRAGLFVYGTLMAPEVLNALLHRVPSKRSAVLQGHSRYTVKDYSFPAIVCDDDSAAVEGMLLEDLSEREMKALDFYEDEAYERLDVMVSVRSADGGNEEAAAMAYVWPLSEKHLLDVGKTWDYEAWRNEKMSDFVKHVVIPCAEEFELTMRIQEQ